MARRVPVKNFHLPLGEDLYSALTEEARGQGRPATEVAREAVRAWLDLRKRRALAESIAVYAREVAGSSADLDRDLERAAVEHLVRSTRSRRRR